VLDAHSGAVSELYDGAASSYEHYRALWLRLAGASAEEAMLADVSAVIRPGARVLDAGAGTGALAREILTFEPSATVTLLDLSAEMLSHAEDVPGERVLASVMDLPFDDESFDVVVSSWVLETVSDPRRAVREYLRVLAPEGHVFYTFCSQPQGFFSRAGSLWLRTAVKYGFAGEFLKPDRTPWHDCERSHRWRFHGGLTSEVALRKCCEVGDGLLPVPEPSTVSKDTP